MEIQFTSLHQIDHTNESIEKVDISNQGNDLAAYINRLLEEITISGNRRRFSFGSETTEVRTAITKIFNEEYEEASEINARRLLEVEKNAQEAIAHLDVEIQKGSLFHAFIKNEKSYKLIISKADHNEYLDEEDFKTHKGLPWKKKIFKALVASISMDNKIESVYVFDTNRRMSRYWWHDYLELKEVYTDTHNTKTSLDLLDRKIFNPIKDEFPADHTILRNSTVRYFRSEEEFELSHFLENTVKNYEPVDKGFPLEKITQKILAMPDKWGFDNRFTIKKEEINKRVVNKIHLTESIDLVLKDYIENLENTIIAGKETDGTKYIKIKTDKGYERFKK